MSYPVSKPTKLKGLIMTIVDHVELDESKHFLGEPCAKEHRYRGQEFSLRLKSNNQCCACKLEYRQKRDEVIHPERVKRKEDFQVKEDKHVSAERFPFNPQHHQLGNLCKERHNYDKTGKTIRKKTKNGLGGNCLACEREQYTAKAQLRIIEQHKTQPYVKDCKCDSCQVELQRRAEIRIPRKNETTKEWREKNPDYPKEWYWRDPKQRRKVGRAYYARNRDRILAFLAVYREENRERLNEIARNWRRSEKGRESRREQKRIQNARKRKEGSIPYTKEQWDERKYLFGNCCAYCGASGKMTLEHVIPLSDSRGFDSIDNVVPACWDCNCKRKNAKRMAYWYPQQPFFTPERFDIILSVLGEREMQAILEDFKLG